MSEALLKLGITSDISEAPQPPPAMRTRRPGAAIVNILRQPGSDGTLLRIKDLDSAKTEMTRLQRVLKAYQAAIDRHAIVAVTNRLGRIVYVNDMFCATSGYSREELIGKPHRIVNSGFHPKTFFTHMWKTIAGGNRWHDEVCNRSKDGSLYWVDTTIVPLAASDGKIEGYVSIRYDITRRKATEANLTQEVEKRRQAEGLLVDIIETVPDGIAAFDPDGHLVLFNKAYRDHCTQAQDAIHLGATLEEILRQGLQNGHFNLQKNTPEAREAWLRGRLKEHRAPGKTLVQSLSDGRWLQIRERRSTSGTLVGTQTDITEIKKAEAAIKFHAEHDPLTGLFNRSLLVERLNEAVAASLQTGQSGILITLDLDGFKTINDTMGHSAGDALLVAVARRLAASVRKSDTVVRLGGDEFAIVLPYAGSKPAASKLALKILSAVQQPLVIQRRAVTPRISLGISIFPRDGRKAEALLKNADLALYLAKDSGRGTYQIFSREMRAGMERSRKISYALTAAVAGERIDIALQPQFSLATLTPVGFEALARWNHNGTAISPAEFIPIAEQTGLIVELGRRVLCKAMEFAGQIKRRHGFCGTTAINVAGAQLRQPGFPAFIEGMALQHGLQPGDIEIELTENILLDDAESQIGRCVGQLRAMGFLIALDDFGTGYASLSHLSRFPVNRLKIDRSFVDRMAEDESAHTIIRATIGLAHSLGMTVVAEGIETEEQLAKLGTCHCDFGQGYHLSRPLEASRACEILARSQAVRTVGITPAFSVERSPSG
jgi:diguanylate cyclase (GGDEF)-like protein/PAS domain S-box-containing protein